LDDFTKNCWDFSKKKTHSLEFDGTAVSTEAELRLLIDRSYRFLIFDENTKIHVKLTLNLDEYLMLSNQRFPVLLVADEFNA